MLVNCYYYAPHNHTLLVEHLDRDLARMASLGTDVVSLCVQEGQLTNWHQQRLHNVVERAHAHGLQVHAVPNRWAGLTAGWLDGFGRFTLEHIDTLIQGKDGLPRVLGEMVPCVNNPKVQDHIQTTLQQLFDLYPIDGLIWDEPHASVCYCPYCRALAPEEPTPVWYHEQFARFIDEMSGYVKTLNPGALVSLFVQPHQDMMLDAFLDKQTIDYLGSDGHVRSEDHTMHRMKGTIFDAHARFYPKIKGAGKKAFFLLEAQRHRDEDLDNYLANVDRAFKLPMDHMMYYYSAHEMSTGMTATFNEATWQAVARRTGAMVSQAV